MKKQILLCVLLLAAIVGKGQVHPQNAILSMKNVGGNYDDVVNTPNAIPTADSGFILSIYSTSNSNTINHSCVLDTAKGEYLFQKYDPSGTNVQWEKCFTITTNFRIEYLFPVATGWIEAGFDGSSQWGPIIRKENTNGTIAWTKSYGGVSVIDKDWKQTADKGYAVLMESYYVGGDVAVAYGTGDMLVVKLDSNGNKQWAKTIGGSNEDMPVQMVVAPDSGIFVVGATESNDRDCTGLHNPMNRDGYVAKLDKNGNILWHLDLGGNEGGLALNGCNDGKGGIVIAAGTASTAGVSYPIANQQGSYWIIDVDKNGHMIWDHCFGNTTGQTYPNSICGGKDGNFYVAGTSLTAGGDVDTSYGFQNAWVVKVDKNTGNMLSECVMGTPGGAEGYMITGLKNGNIFVSGYYDGASTGNNENMPHPSIGNINNDVFVAMLSPWPENVVNITAHDDITVYPNPASKEIMILCPNNTSAVSMVVYDMSGRVMLRKDITFVNGEYRLPIELNSGMYVVELVDRDGVRSVQRLSVL